MISETLLYIGYWTFFGIAHSVLSSTTLKEFSRIPPQIYRIVHNILVTVIFLLVTSASPSLLTLILKSFQLPPIRFASFSVVTGIGMIIFLLGVLKWDLLAFIGLVPEKNEGGLNTTGIYKFSRHPVYTGALLIFFATLIIEISPASLGWSLGAGGYFIWGTIPEEQKLTVTFEKYENYKEKVGRFFPWRKRHFNFLFDRDLSI